jgi:sporulation protein YunB
LKKRLICLLLSIVLFLTAIILRIGFNYSKAFDEFAETYIKANLKIEINKIISENINSRNIQFDEITNVARSPDGRIISILINTAILNTWLLKIEEDILYHLKSSSINLGMPFGNLLGMKMMSGKGPEITVEILPIVSIAQQPKSELLSSGINQTLHRVTTTIETEVKCVAPFYKTECNISSTIVVSETLIVGEIPDIMLSPVG